MTEGAEKPMEVSRTAVEVYQALAKFAVDKWGTTNPILVSEDDKPLQEAYYRACPFAPAVMVKRLEAAPALGFSEEEIRVNLEALDVVGRAIARGVVESGLSGDFGLEKLERRAGVHQSIRAKLQALLSEEKNDD